MRQLLFIRKRSIAPIVLSQHPHSLLEAGHTLFEKLNLPEDLEHILIDSIPNPCVSVSATRTPHLLSDQPTSTIFMADSVEQRLKEQTREKQRQFLSHKRQEIEKEGVTQ